MYFAPQTLIPGYGPGVNQGYWYRCVIKSVNTCHSGHAYWRNKS